MPAGHRSSKLLDSDVMSSLRIGALLLTFWQFLRVAIQALWMLLVARLLGASGYGTFAGYAGFAAAIGSLTGIGFGLTLLQDVSRDRTRFGGALRHAGIAFIMSGLVFWSAYVTTASHFLGAGIPFSTVAYIGIPEVIAFPLTILASYAYQAHERPGMAGVMYAVIPISNLLALGAFVITTRERSLDAYIPYHAAAALLGTTLAWTVMTRDLRPQRSTGWPGRRDVTESAGFSLMRVIDTAMVSLDKSIVLRLGGPEIAGWYTAAFRLASVLAIPASALAMAALPRLFRDHGSEGSHKLARSLLFAALATGSLGIVGMLVGSAALPWLLGPGFAGAAQAARCLCLAPLLMGVAAAGANVLAASGRRRWRMGAQAAGLASLFISGAVALPRYGIAGAAAMFQTALAVAALTLWLAVFLRTPPQKTESAEIET
jgi:O-antigen/teichoic acid export membrane protein